MSKHTIEVRVRYKDTDQMRVAYYSNYLVWFEEARTEFFRAKGMVYSAIEKEDKLFLPVVEAYCRYRSPLRYDDLFTVITTLDEIGKKRMVFSYEVKRGDTLIATGYTKHVLVDEESKPAQIPQKIERALKGS
jgi:acyl-CoA thioester hydrolase